MIEYFNSRYFDALSSRQSLGLFAVRVVMGTAFIYHGLPKIMNAFNWLGTESGIPPIFQALAAVSEFFGGFAILLGLFTPLAAFGLFMTMLVAVGMVHYAAGDPFVSPDGSQSSAELAVVYLALSANLLLNGPGRLSLDFLIWPALRQSTRNVAIAPTS